MLDIGNLSQLAELAPGVNGVGVVDGLSRGLWAVGVMQRLLSAAVVFAVGGLMGNVLKPSTIGPIGPTGPIPQSVAPAPSVEELKRRILWGGMTEQEWVCDKAWQAHQMRGLVKQRFERTFREWAALHKLPADLMDRVALDIREGRLSIEQPRCAGGDDETETWVRVFELDLAGCIGD